VAGLMFAEECDPNQVYSVLRSWLREREYNKPQLIAPLLQRYKTFRL
jgi:hypothetical protein